MRRGVKKGRAKRKIDGRRKKERAVRCENACEMSEGDVRRGVQGIIKKKNKGK